MEGIDVKEPLGFPAPDYGNPDPVPEWMRVDWRRHLHRIELAGAAVNYADVGEGEPIIFIHGLAGCWRNWLENLPFAARTHRAIAIDLPGFGDSPSPSWDISIAAYGRLLREFCERLEIDRVAAVVGNSMGGFVATEAVIAEPERFDRLALVSAAGVSFVRASGGRSGAIARAMQAAGPLLSGDRRVWLARPRGRKLAFGRVIQSPERLRPELLKEQSRPGFASPGFAAAVRSIVGYDTRERLQEIEIPTLIVWGLDDRVVPVEAALAYQRLIPHSRVELFERTGHVPQLERPARFNRLLSEFVESSQPLSAAGDRSGVG